MSPNASGPQFFISTSLSALEAERGAVAPRFAEARRGTITEAQRGARSFGEFLAQRGLTGAGAEAQAEIAQRVAQQEQLGGLRRGEAETFADIERRRAGIESAFAQDVAAAQAGTQAQALQSAIEQQRFQEQMALQRAGLTGQLGGVQ